MDDILRLSLVSPESTIYEGEVQKVVLPGTLGSFEILPRHAPIVSSLKAGTIVYVTPDREQHEQPIKGGFIEMSNDLVSVCMS